MTRFPKLWVVAPLLVVLGPAAYAGYRAHTRRAAVLARITALDGCLAIRNQQRARAADNTLQGIGRVVCRCGPHPPPSDLAVLTEAQQVRGRTQAILDTLHLARQQLQAAGRSPMARQLPALLTRYGAYLQRYAPNAPLLAQPSARLAATGWYGQFAVEQEPLPVALAMLTHLETQLRHGEAAALRCQAVRIGYGCCDLCFDVFRPVVVPVSATVAPGADYQARFFFALHHPSPFCSADLFANGQLLTQVGQQGRLVSFNVPTARPGQPDTVRAAWQGTIHVARYPLDTILSVTVPYLIVKRPAP